MLDKSYVTVVESIKEQIRCAKHKAILNVNFILEYRKSNL